MPEYTAAEVARHNQREDIWVIIGKESSGAKVYNLTGFIDQYPGGSDALLAVAGKNASQYFDDISHLKEYEIGTLISDNEFNQGNGMETIPVDGESDNNNNRPVSAFDNIVPMDKLKNGWSFVSSWAIKTVNNVKEKAVEINNNETVQSYKKSFVESSQAAWEKTKEVTKQATDAAKPYVDSATAATQPYIEKATTAAAPIYEETKKSLFIAVEKTKEATISVSEKMKPVLESAAQTVVTASASAASSISQSVSNMIKVDGDNEGSSGEGNTLGAPSALDYSSKGNIKV
jgi:hypothetical protein